LAQDGRLVTIEFDPKHADVARGNIERAGLADRVDVRVGRAIDVLPRLAAEGAGRSTLSSSTRTRCHTPTTWTGRFVAVEAGSIIIADNP
jgi:tRNA A58 N-methylase Trm61